MVTKAINKTDAHNMGVAAHMVRLVSIRGRLISYLNSGGQKRDEHSL